MTLKVYEGRLGMKDEQRRCCPVPVASDVKALATYSREHGWVAEAVWKGARFTLGLSIQLWSTVSCDRHVGRSVGSICIVRQCFALNSGCMIELRHCGKARR